LLTLAGGESFFVDFDSSNSTRKDRQLYSVHMAMEQGGRIGMAKDLYKKEADQVMSHILSWLISDSALILKVAELTEGLV